MDATALTSDEAIREAVRETRVFGRVTPEQKKIFDRENPFYSASAISKTLYSVDCTHTAATSASVTSALSPV